MRADCLFKRCNAFTIAEILIVMGIIGIIAQMTIPALIQSTQQQEIVSSLLKFDSTLQQAVMSWKQDIGCDYSAYDCIISQNWPDENVAGFDQIAKFLRVSEKTVDPADKKWLPDDTLNYYGNSSSARFGNVSKRGVSTIGYLLQDGTTFSVDMSTNVIVIYVDVNGRKKPNRMGKDTFPFTIGGMRGKDIFYENYYKLESGTNSTGLCAMESYICNPDNVVPTVENGADITAYVMLHHKLPDFQELSKTVAGFRP